jgi:hypothetical protein
MLSSSDAAEKGGIMAIIRWGAAVAAGAIVGALVYGVLTGMPTPAVAQDAKPRRNLESIAEELEAIKGKLPDQAHAMQDVGYHFTNLWFSGQTGHWELANFYWLETRSHLRWAVRIIPKRKDNAGMEVDLEAILTALENGPLKDLEGAIVAKDRAAFEKHYRASLEACYACHKASDKPFLRLQVPTSPETLIINFDPSAQWPK